MYLNDLLRGRLDVIFDMINDVPGRDVVHPPFDEKGVSPAMISPGQYLLGYPLYPIQVGDRKRRTELAQNRECRGSHVICHGDGDGMEVNPTTYVSKNR